MCRQYIKGNFNNLQRYSKNVWEKYPVLGRAQKQDALPISKHHPDHKAWRRENHAARRLPGLPKGPAG